MKIMITGGNGLLGYSLINLVLTKPGVSLVVTGRGKYRAESKNHFQYYDMDITDKTATKKILLQEKPDVIINTAAMSQADDCELNPTVCDQINVEAVETLCNLAGEVDAFFIQLSTDFIFDGSSGPYLELDTPNPLSHYGRSKLASEKIVSSYVRGWAIVRTVLVYGFAPGLGRTNLVLWVKASLEKKQSIKVVNDQWRTPTWVGDLAEGCWLVASKKASGTWHISGEEMLSPYEMALITAQKFDLDKTLIQPVDASIFSQPAIRPPKTGFIIDKAKKQLGYQPHTFSAGLDLLAKQLMP